MKKKIVAEKIWRGGMYEIFYMFGKLFFSFPLVEMEI